MFCITSQKLVLLQLAHMNIICVSIIPMKETWVSWSTQDTAALSTAILALEEKPLGDDQLTTSWHGDVVKSGQKSPAQVEEFAKNGGFSATNMVV